jgi:hypothetical protein
MTYNHMECGTWTLTECIKGIHKMKNTAIEAQLSL